MLDEYTSRIHMEINKKLPRNMKQVYLDISLSSYINDVPVCSVGVEENIDIKVHIHGALWGFALHFNTQNHFSHSFLDASTVRRKWRKNKKTD